MNRDHFITVRVTDKELTDFRAREIDAGTTVFDLMRFRLTG